MLLHNDVFGPSTAGVPGCPTEIVANRLETRGYCHQLVTKVAGVPLSEYRSDLQFLKGLRTCVEAHRSLSGQGIIHRDINPGVILLYDRDIGGILIDNDDARGAVDSMKQRSDATATQLGVRHKPPEMRGSSQFTTAALLAGVAYKWEVTRTLHHDVESFFWVLGYVAMKRMHRTMSMELQEAMHQKPLDEQEAATREVACEDIKHRETILTDLFKESFGQTTITKILKARLLLKPFDFVYEDKLLSTAEATFNLPMRRFMRGLSRNVEAEVRRLHDIAEMKSGGRFVGEAPGPDLERPEHGLRHDLLLKLIDITIHDLQHLEETADVFISTDLEAEGFDEKYDSDVV